MKDDSPKKTSGDWTANPTNPSPEEPVLQKKAKRQSALSVTLLLLGVVLIFAGIGASLYFKTPYLASILFIAIWPLMIFAFRKLG